MLGIVELPFSIGDRKYVQQFHVIPHDNNNLPILLGLPFLDENRATLDFNARIMTINGVEVQLGPPRRIVDCTAGP